MSIENSKKLIQFERVDKSPLLRSQQKYINKKIIAKSKLYVNKNLKCYTINQEIYIYKP